MTVETVLEPLAPSPLKPSNSNSSGLYPEFSYKYNVASSLLYGNLKCQLHHQIGALYGLTMDGFAGYCIGFN